MNQYMIKLGWLYKLSNKSMLVNYSNVDSLKLMYPELPISIYNMNHMPLTIKNGTWNYETLKAAAAPNNLVFIEDVRISTFNTATNQLIGKNAMGSVIHITAELYRFPKLA